MGQVVLITGGSGFLAQHLIRELQHEFSQQVAEIRLVDKKPFQQRIAWPDLIPISHMVVDCSDRLELEPVIAGSADGCIRTGIAPHVIFNLAGTNMPLTMYHQQDLCYKDNVQVTETVLSLSLEYNVARLIHVSDAFCVSHLPDSQGLLEVHTNDGPANGRYYHGIHARIKFQAERIARNANGTTLKNGDKLSVGIVRPVPMYGEADSWLVPYALRLCHKYGRLYKLGDDSALLQMVYAGNVAHMLCVLSQALQTQPEKLGSEVFFCNEYRPPQWPYGFLAPILENAGFSITNWNIPEQVAIPFLFAAECISGLLQRCGISFDHQLPNWKVARCMAVISNHVDAWKARLVINYLPKYHPDAAMQQTLAWWKNETQPGVKEE